MINENLTIAEIRDKRIVLQVTINALLDGFEKETGLYPSLVETDFGVSVQVNILQNNHQ